jgi:hypothetical protein
MIAEESWSKVKLHFLKMSDVQKQGESLKIKKKMFAMFSKGSYVVKLSKERVEELISSEDGLPYDPGNGKIMKEWVIIPEKNVDKLIEFASEAKKFTETFEK